MVVVVGFVLAVVSDGYGQQPHCRIVRDYLQAIQNHCIYRFGEEREKALGEAKATFQRQLKDINVTLDATVDELIKRYTACATLGYDKMRKGDTALVKKAQDLADRIKALCPWD
jgi:hypothetical protein